MMTPERINILHTAFRTAKLRGLHNHIMPPKMGSGNSRKMASPLDFNPCYPHYWSAHSQDALFGAHLDSLSSQFTGFSVCHPIYNDHSEW